MNKMYLKTKSGNNYYFNNISKSWLLIAPLLRGEIERENSGKSELSLYTKRKVQGQNLENLYYKKKYKFLRDNNFFVEKLEIDNLDQLDGELVKQNLANTTQILFEVTENCNLSCKYCAYGEIYVRGLNRGRSIASIENASSFLKFVLSFINSEYNSTQKSISIGFYGGEPLLGFDFIKEMVLFCNNSYIKDNNLKFNITTNGILLQKYIEFLIQHQFSITISLDGDESNNEYRLTKGGKSQYLKIVDNISYIQRNYPDYFKNNVTFNCVLHNKNSVSGIYSFFKEKFQKIPRILPLNDIGVLDEKKEVFFKMYRNYQEESQIDKRFTSMDDEIFETSLRVMDLASFIHSEIGHNYTDYFGLYMKEDGKRSFLTGTCLPFSKKIFLTVQGKILPCERIEDSFPLGKVENGVVKMNFGQIAEFYNRMFESIAKICTECYLKKSCRQCIYHLDGIKRFEPICKNVVTKSDYLMYLENMLNEIENDKKIYLKILSKMNIT